MTKIRKENNNNNKKKRIYLDFRRNFCWSFEKGRPTVCHWVLSIFDYDEIVMIAAIVVNLNDAYDDRINGCHYQFLVNSNHLPPNYFAPSRTRISDPCSYLYSYDVIIELEHSNAPNDDDNRAPADVHNVVKLAEGTDALHAQIHEIDPMVEQFCFLHPVKPQ